MANTPRAPVLGPPKKPPFTPPSIEGSPATLMYPAAVLTTPRAPVTSGPRPIKFATAFILSSPLVLLVPPAKPTFAADFSKPYFPRTQIDATKPTNINLYRNPLPFGPYDYSAGPTRVPNAAAKQFNQQPNYPNFYPNPRPFGPYDYSEGPVSVARVPPMVVQRNPLVYSEVPFGPFDWSKAVAQRAVSQLPAPPFNLALNTIVVTVPFFNPDFSKPYFLTPVLGFVQAGYSNFYPNPIPFIPVDYNIQHDVVSSPPQALPYNINVYTNPLPFGPFDYNTTHNVISSPPQALPYNPNIFTNPLPFGPFDYNVAHDVISSPPQAAPYNINVYVNPIPLGPYDLSKGATTVPRVPPAPIERNPLIFSEVPFLPVDTSKTGQFPPRAPDQIYPNIPLSVVVVAAPFIPVDFSKPYFPQVRVDNNLPTNINIFTNPIPLGPYDWSARPGQYPPRAPDQTYPDLVLLQAPPPAPPFIPIDYSKPFFPQIRIDATQPTNINVFTNPIPFGPFDYQISHDVVASPPQAVPYNINIFVNPIPLGPYDWSARPQMLPRTPPQPQPYNPLIFSEVPLIQPDFSKPYQIKASPVPPAPPYTISILVPVVAPPFIPVDFQKPYFPQIRVDQTQPTNINVFTNPIPLGPYDWSARPQFLPRSPPQPLERNPLIFSEVPITPVDLSRSFAVRSVPQLPTPYNVTLYLRPFFPPDLSNSRPLPRFQPVAQPYNLALTSVPTAAPFQTIDWSKPFAIRGLVPQPPPNITVRFPPAPLIPTDWSKPSGVRISLPHPLPNLTIKLPPPAPSPFIPFDWSKPYAIRPVAPQGQPNLTLYLPPPPSIGTPAVCYTRDIAAVAAEASDVASTAAAAKDVATATAKASDVGAQAVEAKDVPAATFQANEDSTNRDRRLRVLKDANHLVVLSILPSEGPPGTVVTITGSGFMGTISVIINGMNAAFTVINDDTLIVTIP